MSKSFATLALVGAFSTWYAASTVCNSTARQILQEVSAPLHLCLAQFIIAFGCSNMYFLFRRERPTKVPKEAHTLMWRLAVVYTVGFIFVNAGYVVINVSLAETLRAAEPVMSVLLSFLFVKQEVLTWPMIWSLVPIVLGGALSSYGDGSFTPIALLFVSVSNVCFSTRSMLTKQLASVYTGTPFSVFYHITRLGSSLLIIFTFLLELAFAFGFTGSEVASLGPALADGRLGALSSTLFLNGITYWMYNQMSYVVLMQVHMVTHAVGNAFRRVVTILCSVWYFGNHVSPLNAGGIALAFCGVTMYSIAKVRIPNTGNVKSHNQPLLHTGGKVVNV